ncbi:tetratricopeptide repeat protein [Amycolatopsis sp. GM8]|uniref:tetratricopeptide repeat protein n=1 Tax=Amycolatopsis sp. GM8 TaxID=2896530 RepID=UPI001F008C5A|nr:tetratricopeptide repeat protein [Amycolatopsis sp. GM8]
MFLVAGGSGLGKTTLLISLAKEALRWGFPALVIYVDLNGTSGDGQIEGIQLAILRKLGVSEAVIDAAGSDGLARLYQVETTARHFLLLLDNVKSRDQARELCPGPGNTVVLTSRTAAPALAALCEDTINLTGLGYEDAKNLLVGLAGAERIDADLDAVKTLVAQCEGLPLALLLVGTLLVSDEAMTVRQVVDGLEARESRKANGRSKQIESVLDLCYARLEAVEPNAARLFRCLGASVGRAHLPPLPRAALAALARLFPGTSDAAVDILLHWQLAKADRRGRIYLHGTVRQYAARKLGRSEDALKRLIRWYTGSAYAGGNALADGWAGDLIPDTTGIVPHEFSSERPDLVLAWFEQERSTMVAVLRDFGHVTPNSWQLPVFCLPALFIRRPLDDCRELAQRAVRLAQNNDFGRGRCLHLYAWVENETTAGAPATRCLDELVDLHDRIADERGRAWTMYVCGQRFAVQREFAQADRCFREALRHFRATGFRFGIAIVQSTRAVVLDGLGRDDDARSAAQEGLTIACELGNIPLRAFARDQVGFLYQQHGEFGEAIRIYGQVLHDRHRSGERWGIADTLLRQGQAFAGMGDRERAREALTTSLAIFQELRDHRQVLVVQLALASLDIEYRAGN